MSETEYSDRPESMNDGDPKNSPLRNSFASPAYTRMRSRVAEGIRTRETTWEAIRASLWSTEYLSLGMLLLYTLLDIIFIRQVKASFGILQINLIVMVGILAFAMWYDQTGSRIPHIFRSFYILPVGYMMYAQVHNYI